MRKRVHLTLTLVFMAAALVAGTEAFGAVAKVESGIEFSYIDPYAGSVSLAGQFNEWNVNANPMKMDEEGVWRVVIELGPGDHEYKFVINGSQWIADPDNPVVVGDYGNSVLKIGEDGELVVGAGPTAAVPVSNTPINSRVRLTGWYRATYDTRWEVPSDPRFRLTRPTHDFYISVNPTVNQQVSGSATLRMTSGAGDIKELHADVYSGWATLKGGPFTVSGFYNEEFVQLDDPLETLGHTDLVGTIPEEHVAFGRGAQGVVASADILPGKFDAVDLDFTAVYANIYDYDIYNDPRIYDNTDTDVMAARLKSRVVDKFGVGLTYTSWRDGWWMPWTGSNESSHLEQYIEESGSTSDWFELSKSDWIFGVDARVDLETGGGPLSLAAEYGFFKTDGRWDVGNKEKVEGEDYSNGSIDVPYGDTDGSIKRVILEAQPLPPVDLRFEGTFYSIAAMDTTETGLLEEYVAYDMPPWMDVGIDFAPLALLPEVVREYTEVRYSGSPLVVNVYNPLPEMDGTNVELDAGLSFGILDLDLELDREVLEGSYDWLEHLDMPVFKFETNATRYAARFAADILDDRVWVELLGEHVEYGMKGGFRGDEVRGLLPYYRSYEYILRERLELAEQWGLLADLRYIHYSEIGEVWEETGEYESWTYLTPYVAVIFSPRQNVEIRLGYGVNPDSYIDTPVEGRGNGRERWRADHMSWAGEHGLLESEQAMENERTLEIMALVAF